MNDKIMEIAPLLGLILFLSIFAGKIAQGIGVPKVTAFILLGLILGPSVLGVLSQEIMKELRFIDEIAFGLILFNIGGKFNKEFFQKMQLKHVKMALVQSLLTFSITSILLFILLFTFTEQSLESQIIIAILLGIIAIEAAPPTTLIVIKEYSSQGPLTDAILFFLAISTVCGIIFSDVAVMIFEITGLWNRLGGNNFEQIFKLLWHTLAPIPIGIGLGLLLSYWEQKEINRGEIFLTVITLILSSLGLSYHLHFSSLLTSLILGITVINTSHVGENIHKSIGEMGLSLYAIFFVFAGAHIDFNKQLKTIGFVGIAYILSRILGILGSSFLTSTIFKESVIFGKRRGLSLLGHAGAALAIATQFKMRDEESAQTIFSVIMSSIFFFEVIGPFSLKYALKKEGEISSGKKDLKSKTSKNTLTPKELFLNFLINVRILFPKTIDPIGTIQHLIKRDVVAITLQATFDEIMHFFEENRSPLFPVVDKEHHFHGIISMKAFESAMQHTETHSLIVASNLLAGETLYLYENTSYREAIDLFKQYQIEILPVVKVNKIFVGLLSYRDVVMAMKQAPIILKES